MYKLPELPFEYDALEPFIDKETMKVHHDKHHRAYVDKLNEAILKFPAYEKPVEDLLASLPSLPRDLITPVLENGGGHANHTLFWSLLWPATEGKPVGRFASVLDSTFGSCVSFKEEFTVRANEHFSNGWAWLCTDHSGALEILTTKDHETPISQGKIPLIVADLWEHAYYLKYKNERAEYLKVFWKVLNWSEVANRWEEFMHKGESHREWLLAS